MSGAGRVRRRSRRRAGQRAENTSPWWEAYGSVPWWVLMLVQLWGAVLAAVFASRVAEHGGWSWGNEFCWWAAASMGVVPALNALEKRYQRLTSARYVDQGLLVLRSYVSPALLCLRSMLSGGSERGVGESWGSFRTTVLNACGMVCGEQGSSYRTVLFEAQGEVLEPVRSVLGEKNHRRYTQEVQSMESVEVWKNAQDCVARVFGDLSSLRERPRFYVPSVLHADAALLTCGIPRDKGGIHGMINVYSPQPHVFSRVDCEIVEAMTQLLALGYEVSRTVGEGSRREW